MKTIFYLVTCLSISFICSIGYAAELPYLKSVFLKVKVTRDAQGIFTYGYEIANGSENSGVLTRFSVDISKPDNGVPLSNMGLFNASKNISGLGVLKMP